MRGVAPRAAGALSKSRAALGKMLAPPNEGGEEPPSSGWRGRLSARAPLILLALALAVALLLNLNRERFYAPLEWDTAKNLAIAENLSPAHNFRMFVQISYDEDGDPSYVAYSRFPIGGYALIKLVMLPFGDNLAAKVFAARMLMLAFFIGAAFLAYHSILRISSNRWIALIATLTGFSSYYILRYHNQVSNEFMMGLFAVMLTFHGMLIFLQEGRFRQLLVKTCIALLIGWHVYAFLLPFVALGAGSELVDAIRMRRGFSTLWRALLSIAARSRYIRLGAAALLFGAGVLTFNIMSEYDALNGETPLAELPSVNSIVIKLSLDSDNDGGFPWGNFLRAQFYRVAGSVLPALTDWPGFRLEEPPNAPPLPLVAMGILALGAAVAGLLFVRRGRLPLAVLALSGLCWALLVRVNAHRPEHQFEAIYYVGVPLALVTLLLFAACRFGCARLLPAVAVAAALAFAISSSDSIARGVEVERDAERQQLVFADMRAIREIAEGKNVLVVQGARERGTLYGGSNAMEFYLAGSRFRHSADASPNGRDFVLIAHRDEAAPLLTPRNRIAFLYGDANPADLLRSRIDFIASSASGEPAARAVYDVSIAGRDLVYVKEPCGVADVEPEFFLHVFPEDVDDLPERRREHGYDNLDFVFQLWGVSFDGACAAMVPLPEYPVDSIRTGQWADGRELWDAGFPFNSDALRARYEEAASGEPDARAVFDLYLDEAARTLTYAKQPCEEADVKSRFFLHVTPERASDLPEGRREVGFDNRDFDFDLNGVVFDGKCVAEVALPEYGIAGMRTGQWVLGESEPWRVEIQARIEAARRRNP